MVLFGIILLRLFTFICDEVGVWLSGKEIDKKPSHSLARVEVRVLASPVCVSGALSLVNCQVEGELLGVRAC